MRDVPMRELIIRCSLFSICGLAMLLMAGSAAGRTERVTLCHVPPENPANADEIVISKRAVKSHLRNHSGDFVGTCDDGPCCDPTQEPSGRGNLFCITGHTCCDDGIWQCNDAAGSDTCPGSPGPVCEGNACCDPAQEPGGVGGNPFCIEGHTCCDDGTWRCNAADGTDRCQGHVGLVCECDPDFPVGSCCDPNAPPGDPNECDRGVPNEDGV